MPTQQYIYAVVRADDPLAGLPGAGVGNAEIRTIEHAGLACIVSDFDDPKLRPSRANLSAHHGVAHALTERTGALPTPFGTLAEHADDVRAMLAEHAEEFHDAIDRVEGRVEMTLAVRWDAGTIIEHLVETDDGLRARRDAMLASPTHDAQMDVGRAVEQALSDLRDATAEAVTPTLDRVCVETRPEDTRDDAELARIACLIPKDASDAFDQALEAIARLLDDRYLLAVAGPFPCQSFIDIELGAPDRAETPEDQRVPA